MPGETLIEPPDFALHWRTTRLGLRRADFLDTYENQCSIQEALSVTPRLWLGVDTPHRQSVSQCIGEHAYAFLCRHSVRMRLSKLQALALGRAMIEWAEAQADPVSTDGNAP